MKVSICEKDNIKQTEVVILCVERNAFIDKLAKKIEQLSFFIVGRDGEKVEQIPIDEIYYFESVDNNTYLYCRKDVYGCNVKLYELEEKLKGTSFQRISKSSILNLDRMKSAKGLINGRLLVILDNNEKLIVNRSYVLKIRDFIRQ
jgi:two-component system, LytTR family, response regulator LytT